MCVGILNDELMCRIEHGRHVTGIRKKNGKRPLARRKPFKKRAEIELIKTDEKTISSIVSQ